MKSNNIGERIRFLRIDKGYTQEKLGEILNVSSQSISKWERSTTFPDISLLPKIATTFGVTIDELFIQSSEDTIKKIENMLDFKDDLSYGEESYILQKLDQNSAVNEVNRLKAKLYLKRGKTYLKMSQDSIIKALDENPGDKESHYIYLSTNNGIMTDWNFFNKLDIIKYYKSFVDKNPSIQAGYLHLLDHLIHDCRLDEAQDLLAKYKTLDDTFRPRWYQARINQQRTSIDPIIQNFEGEWLQHSIKADEYAKIGKYEKAIKEYEIAYKLQPSPKYIDSLECIANIYEIRGLRDKAKEYYKKIVNNLEEEWSITFGSSVDYYNKKSH